MPHAWALVDNSFPTFTEGDSPQDQITALIDYMMILTEALKYQLENLDTNNWNTTALENFQLDTTKDVSEQFATIAKQLSAVTNEVAAMKIRLSTAESRAAQAETDISYLETKQEEMDGAITDLQEQIGNAQADIDELQGMLSRDDQGNVVLGKTGETVHLYGKIYINGVLLE